MAAEQHAPEAESVERAEQVGGVLLHRVAVLGLVAEPAPAKVEGEHAQGGHEAGSDDPVEEVRVRGEPVRQHERRPVALVLEVVEADAVRLDEAALAHAGASPQRTTLAAQV